jgi:hypothetical protein
VADVTAATKALFTPAEGAFHRESLEMLSAARTLGRSHATLQALAQDPPPPQLPDIWVPGPGQTLTRLRPSDQYAERREQVQEALEDGSIVATPAGRYRYRSNVLMTAEYRQLREIHGSDFVDEFNQAASEQWQYMRAVQIVHAVLLVSDLLQAGDSQRRP